MGAYLSSPLTDKESADEINSLLSCGASQMQGWRMSQEVKINYFIKFPKNLTKLAKPFCRQYHCASNEIHLFSLLFSGCSHMCIRF